MIIGDTNLRRVVDQEQLCLGYDPKSATPPACLLEFNVQIINGMSTNTASRSDTCAACHIFAML